MEDLINWHTIVRRRDTPTSYSAPAVALHSSSHMAHNAAFLCVTPPAAGEQYPSAAHVIAAFGGRSQNGSSVELGVRRIDATTATGSWPPTWRRATPGSAAAVVLRGTQTGCTEARTRKNVIVPGDCEFDGKLSLVHYRSRYLLFARANMHVRAGARHVQMASSADGVRGWSNFSLLTIATVSAGEAENNVYFLLPIPWRPRVLVGLMPAVLVGRGGGIFLVVSRDGLRWSAPQRLLRASRVSDRRTDEYPVGLRCPPYRLHCLLHVEHGVASIGTIHTRAFAPRHCEYALDASRLNATVGAALASLDATPPHAAALRAGTTVGRRLAAQRTGQQRTGTMPPAPPPTAFSLHVPRTEWSCAFLRPSKCASQYAPRCNTTRADALADGSSAVSGSGGDGIVGSGDGVDGILPRRAAAATPPSLVWVHVPKCGSSFLNALLALCPGFPPCARLLPGDTLGDFLSAYPPWRFCPREASAASSCLPVRSPPRTPEALPWTSCHDGLLEARRAGARGLLMLRQPEQRLISAYRHDAHGYVGNKSGLTAAAYARQMQGCAVRTLVRGGPCGRAPLPSRAEVDAAIDMLSREFVFIGLTELWVRLRPCS